MADPFEKGKQSRVEELARVVAFNKKTEIAYESVKNEYLALVKSKFSSSDFEVTHDLGKREINISPKNLIWGDEHISQWGLSICFSQTGFNASSDGQINLILAMGPSSDSKWVRAGSLTGLQDRECLTKDEVLEAAGRYFSTIQAERSRRVEISSKHQAITSENYVAAQPSETNSENTGCALLILGGMLCICLFAVVASILV